MKAAAQRLAREDGVPLSQWIAVAVAEKIGAGETAADFLKRRAGNAKPEDMIPFLEDAPDEPPAPGGRAQPMVEMGRAKRISPADSAGPEAVIAELRALGSEANRVGMARFGINTERAFGISMKALELLARKHRRDHRLAGDLWASGYHEARLLAALIDDPREVSPQQMDAWAADLDSWDLCDQACLKLFEKTPFVEEKIVAWAADEREFVRRAGFALMAAYAVHGKAASDATFIRLLSLVEEHAGDGRNYVRKAVNWALRQIGKRSATLHEPALGLAKRLAASDDKTARWIGRDAVKELSGRVGWAKAR